MALLTNINGKFSVSDAGAVTFNNAFTFPTADGAANYVLQTNGSGQLAWALNGNGDISGSGTANTVTKFTGSGTGVKTIGNGPITFSGDNSTFAGSATATGVYTAGNSAIIYKAQRTGGAVAGDWSYDDATTDMSLGTSTAHSFSLKTDNTKALTINNSQNATFIGDVSLANLKSIYLGTSSALRIYTDSAVGYLRGNDVRLTNAANDSIIRVNGDVAELYHNDIKKLETTSTGVTVTNTVAATTFSGDLNGTINTVTTAATKGNSTNDTTVATTAFVQNVVGTIPAGLVFQGTWNANTNTPTLTSGSGTTGNFYIVSVAGSTNLDGITDWQVGDWAVFIEQGASDQWEKIDNSSVLGGSGTGGSFAGWSGSGTSVTLGNAPVTFSGNNSTFAGSVTLSSTGPLLYLANTTSTTGKTWRFSSAANGKFFITQEGVIDAVTLDHTTGNATFAGDVSLLDNKILQIGTGNDLELYHNNSSVFSQIRNNTGDLYITNLANDKDIIFQGNDGGSVGTVLTLDMSEGGNATFAGSIIATSANLTTSGTVLSLDRTGGATALIELKIGGTIEGYLGATTTKSLVVFNESAAEKFSVSNAGDGTFAGSITSTGLNVNAGTYHKVIATFPSTYKTNLQIGQQLNISNDAITDTVTFANTGAEAVSEFLFTIAGNPKLKIQGNGNVGIGTTSPTSRLSISGLQAAIDITRGNSGDSKWEFSSDSTGLYFSEMSTGTRAYMMTIKETTGNVGIGTTSPAYQLTVSKNSGFHEAGLNTFQSSAGAAHQELRIISDAHGGGGRTGDIAFYTANSATATEKMRIRSSGTVGIGAAGFDSQMLTIAAGNLDGAIYATSTDANCFASFRDNSSTANIEYGAIGNNHVFRKDATEKMRIDSSGNVKVGRPSGYGNSRIQSFIASTANFATPAYLAADSTNMALGVGGEISFVGKYATGVDDYAFYGGIKGFKENATSGNTACALGFYTRTSGTLPTEKMRITSDGNVGIGVTNPDAKLEIKGTGASTGLTFKTTDSLDNETFYINDGGVVGVRYYPFKIGVPSGTTNVANSRFQIATTAGDFVVLNDGKTGIGTTSPSGKFHVKVGTSTPLIVSSNSYCNNVGIRTTTPTASLQVKGNISYSYVNYTNVANTWINVISMAGYPTGLYQISIIKKTNASTYVSAIIKWDSTASASTAGTIVNTITSNQLGVGFNGSTTLQAISGISTGTLMSANLKCLVMNEDYCS